MLSINTRPWINIFPCLSSRSSDIKKGFNEACLQCVQTNVKVACYRKITCNWQVEELCFLRIRDIPIYPFCVQYSDSGLSPSMQKCSRNCNSPLNRIMVWFDHFCRRSCNKNSPLNRYIPLNRISRNRDTTVPFCSRSFGSFAECTKSWISCRCTHSSSLFPRNVGKEWPDFVGEC